MSDKQPQAPARGAEREHAGTLARNHPRTFSERSALRRFATWASFRAAPCQSRCPKVGRLIDTPSRMAAARCSIGRVSTGVRASMYAPALRQVCCRVHMVFGVHGLPRTAEPLVTLSHNHASVNCAWQLSGVPVRAPASSQFLRTRVACSMEQPMFDKAR